MKKKHKKIPSKGYIALYIPIYNPFLSFGKNSVNNAYPIKNIWQKRPPKKLIIIRWIGPMLNNKLRWNIKDIIDIYFNTFARPHLSGSGTIYYCIISIFVTI